VVSYSEQGSSFLPLGATGMDGTLSTSWTNMMVCDSLLYTVLQQL